MTAPSITPKALLFVCLVALVLVGATFALLRSHKANGEDEIQTPNAEVRLVTPPTAATISEVNPAPGVPVYAAPRVSDERLGVFVDRSSSLEGRLFEDMRSWIPTVQGKVDIAAVVAVVRDPLDNDVVRHEAVNLLRRSDYRGLESVLMDVALNEHDGARFRGWAVQHLGDMADDDADLAGRVTPFLRSAMDQGPDEMRCEAVLALARLEDAVASQRISQWLVGWRSQSEPRLDVAIRCAGERGLIACAGSIIELLMHPSERIRVAAIISLGMLRVDGARSDILALTTHHTERIRLAAANALRMYDATPEVVSPEGANSAQ